jgi:hypothetical protein
MRKTIKRDTPESVPDKGPWLDVAAIAQVEVTSENPLYPIESAFGDGDKRGWRAAEPGKQTISLLFEEPQRIGRIRLQFVELHVQRTQQFTLQWSKDRTDALRPLFQQQWNFSPSGSTIQTEDYRVELDGVWMLQLIIEPDISRGPAVATLESWRLA